MPVLKWASTYGALHVEKFDTVEEAVIAAHHASVDGIEALERLEVIDVTGTRIIEKDEVWRLTKPLEEAERQTWEDQPKPTLVVLGLRPGWAPSSLGELRHCGRGHRTRPPGRRRRGRWPRASRPVRSDPSRAALNADAPPGDRVVRRARLADAGAMGMGLRRPHRGGCRGVGDGAPLDLSPGRDGGIGGSGIAGEVSRLTPTRRREAEARTCRRYGVRGQRSARSS